MARGSAGESVLHKHLRILETFDAWHPFLSLSEIADAAGLARSSTHRLVSELEAEGLLERLPDRSYRLGVRLWEFASRTPGALGLREVARPWLNAVHERVRQHTQLGVLSGREVVFIERMSTTDAVINATLIGGRIPLHASSIGLVLLASASPELTEDVIAHGLRVYTDRTISDPDELRARLRRVRAEGYAEAAGQIHPESRGIAVPVAGPHGVVYAAMGVVVANDDSSPGPYVDLLKQAAQGVTRSLEDVYLPDAGDEPPGPGHASRPPVGMSRRSREYFDALTRPAGADRVV